MSRIAFALLTVLLATAAAQGAAGPDEGAPTIETRDGDMEFRLRRDAEATFTRDRRETVTVFTLATEIGDLQRKMTVVDAAVTSIPTVVSSLVTAVNAQGASIQRIDDLVKQVEGAKSISDVLKSDLENLKNSLSAVQADVSSFKEVGKDVAVAKSEISNVKSAVSSIQAKIVDLDKAIAASETSTIATMNLALAAAKATTDKAIADAKKASEDAIAEIGGGGGGEATYINWNRQECNGGAKTLYKGYAWGNHHDHRGGTNPICIKEGSQAGNSQSHGSLDQMHYISTDHCASHTTISPCNRPVACALCSIEATCYMESGTGSCTHPDYKSIYGGWLFGGHYSHQAQTERICLDEQGQYPASGASGAYIYPVSTQNGFAGRSGGRTVKCNWCCRK